MVANSYTTTIDDIASATMQKLRPQIADAAFDASPFWGWMKEKGRMSPESGGRFIETRVLYDKNRTVTPYSRFERLPTNPTESVTGAIYNWRQYAGSVVIDGYEESINSGPEQIFDILGHQVELLKRSFADRMAEDLLAQVGTKDVTKAITGLEEIIEPAAGASQGTLGGINKQTYTWWQNQYLNVANYATSSASDSRFFYTTFTKFYNDCRQQLVRPSDQMALTTQTVYETIEKEERESMRTAPVDQRMYELGWTNFKFKGTPTVWDTRVYQDGVNNHRYFLVHAPDLKMCVHKNRNFVMTPFRTPADQDAKVAYMLFMGQLITMNNRHHGVINISNIS